jgi:glycosyltransferase involved in cell wall biosynthesis
MLIQVGARDVRLCVLGVDLERYRVLTPPERRFPGRVGFPVRMEPVKSPEILEGALRLLRGRFGSAVSLWGFGHAAVPSGILDLLDEYHVHPDNGTLADLYDRSAIFAVPSRKEGFGMPAAEAMSSGCAVVSTDNGGIGTFGIDGENCVLVPVESPERLAEAVAQLVEDPVRRIGIANRAPDSVRFLRWTEAGDRLARQLEV